MWSVVQTIDRLRGKELSVVPNSWLDKTGKNVHWPTSKSKSAQMDLAKNPRTKPNASWSKMPCLVKRMNLTTYEEADAVVESMSGGSSSESSFSAARFKKPTLLKSSFQHLLVQNETIEESDEQTPPSLTLQQPRPLPSASYALVSSPISETMSPMSPMSQFCDEISPMSPLSFGSPLVERSPRTPGSFAPAHNNYNSAANDIIVLPVDCAPSSSETILKELQNISAKLDASTMDSTNSKQIVEELAKITTKLASQQTTLEMLLDRVTYMEQNSSGSVNQINRIPFKPIDNKAQLRELNTNLGDASFKTKIVSIFT